jgi:N-acetylglucosamine kinase
LHAHLSGGDGVSAEQLAARHNAGDPQAGRVFALHLDLLGAALARIVLAYDPHVIVLGGGLSQLPHLYSGLAGAIRPHLIPGLGVPPILPPAFGDAGGARGAALLARQATTTQEP